MVERFDIMQTGQIKLAPKGEFVRHDDYARLEAFIDGEGCPDADRIGALFSQAEAAEAERDRLREGCLIYAASLRGPFSTRYEVAEGLEILAALQKEPQP